MTVLFLMNILVFVSNITPFAMAEREPRGSGPTGSSAREVHPENTSSKIRCSWLLSVGKEALFLLRNNIGDRRSKLAETVDPLYQIAEKVWLTSKFLSEDHLHFSYTELSNGKAELLVSGRPSLSIFSVHSLSHVLLILVESAILPENVPISIGDSARRPAEISYFLKLVINRTGDLGPFVDYATADEVITEVIGGVAGNVSHDWYTDTLSLVRRARRLTLSEGVSFSDVSLKIKGPKQEILALHRTLSSLLEKYSGSAK